MLVIQNGHYGNMTENGEIVDFYHPEIQRPRLQTSELTDEYDHSKRLYSIGAGALHVAASKERL